MLVNTTIGAKIKAYRTEHDLSQAAFGQKMDVSGVAVFKWESGKALPTIDKLFRLAEILGCPVNTLLGLSPAEKE